MLVVSAIMLSNLFGLLPDDRAHRASNRAALSESLATNLGILISKHQLEDSGQQLEMFAKQNEEVVSVGLRRDSGELVIEIGEHERTWQEAVDAKSDGCYLVPIANSQARWGTLEVQFSPIYVGINQYFSYTLLQMLVLVVSIVGLAGWLHLRRILKFLDPQKAVPPRVREALDNFAEGVVILDSSDQMILVNATFAKHAGL